MFEPKTIPATVDGEEIIIRQMTAKERLEVERKSDETKDKAENGFVLMCETVARCVLTPAGAPVFPDAAAAGAIAAANLVDLFNLAAVHNGIQAKASAEKNG
jgi:hypothetical protein